MKKTRAFILSYIKYGDSSVIIKTFSKNFGFRSFILKNAFSKKNKRHHLLLILNEVEITFYPSKNELFLVKELSQGQLFHESYNNIIKSSVLTFLGETLNQVLRNEEIEDYPLYDFLLDNLTLFDCKENYYSDFHLYFLLKLSRYLGFYPLTSENHLLYFNLQEGVFSQIYNVSKIENAFLWNKLMKYNFDTNNQNCFSSAERNLMLEEIITYYEHHIDKFHRPLSLDVLKVLFH